MRRFIKKNPFLFALMSVTFIVFLNTLSNAILKSWDDFDQILNNVAVKNLSLQNIKVYFTSYVLQSYQPIASLSFAIEYFLFKETAAVYHLTNVLLHLANVFLIFKILTLLFKNDKNLILFVTAVFALHPMQVETVAWLSTRSTLLFSLFLLLSVYQYLKYVSEQKTRHFLWAFFFFILALFSKSTAIILPGVIILMDLFLSRKISKKVILEKVPFVVLALVFGIVSIKSRGVESGLVSTFVSQLGYDFVDRIMVSSYSFLFYLIKFIFPFDLHHLYGYPLKMDDITLPPFFKISPFIVLFILIGLGWILKKSKREYRRNISFGFFFYLINIFLVLNIVAFLAYISAERYIYLGIIGLAVLLWTFISFVMSKKKAWKDTIWVVVFSLFGFYIIKSYQQIEIWKDSKTLFLHITDSYKNNDVKNNSAFKVWQILAGLYNKEGNIPKVIDCYSEAIKFKNDEPILYLYRGYALSNQGRYKEALKDFSSVIENKNIRKGKEELKLAYTNRAYTKDVLFSQYRSKKLLQSILPDLDSALVFDKGDKKLLAKKQEVIKKLAEFKNKTNNSK